MGGLTDRECFVHQWNRKARIKLCGGILSSKVLVPESLKWSRDLPLSPKLLTAWRGRQTSSECEMCGGEEAQGPWDSKGVREGFLEEAKPELSPKGCSRVNEVKGSREKRVGVRQEGEI